MKDKIKGKLHMFHQQKAKDLGKKLSSFRLNVYIVGGIIAVFGLLALVVSSRSAYAACAAPATNYGSATQTVSVASSGTYRAWSRLMIPSTTNNSYLLEVDGGTCYTVGGSSSIPISTWTWVDYQNGASTSKIDLTLSAGTHTLKLIGNSAGLKLDRLLLLGDTTCVPTGTGDNCLVTPPPNIPPTTTLSASPTTLTQGQTVTLTASATDNASSTITKVDFYDGSTLLGTDTTSPYSFLWITSTSTSTGSHTLTAKATDAVPLTGTSSPVTVTVNAAPPADTTAPTVSLTAPTNGATVKGATVGITATATDNTGGSGMKQVVFKLDNTTTLATDTTSPYSVNWDSTTVGDGPHTLTAIASDNAGNTSSSSVSVNVSNAPPADTTPPTVSLTAPANGSTVSGSAVALSATATDNVAVASVTFSVDGTTVGSPDTTTPYSVNWDSMSVINGTHTVTAKAVDTSNNNATSQFTVNVQNGDITAPSAPTNLSARIPAYNQVDLSWTASVDNTGGGGIGGYYIVRNGSTIAKTVGTATSYSDTTVTASSNYTYYVYAYDLAGNLSTNSNSALATTPSQPDTQAPTWSATGANLAATAVSPSQINLTWTDATDNIGVKSYQIFRNNSTTPVAVVNAPATSWGDTGLAAGTTYSYTVRAVDAAGNVSVASNTASATTQVTPPPNQTGNLAGSVTLSNSVSPNPYSCSTHPTLTKVASAPTDTTILNCAKRLQWFLNSLNNAGLSVDGWFGNNTLTAVKNYQTKYNLTADGSGIVGSQTWNSLESKGSSSATNPYSCSTHPTLTKVASAPTDTTILNCAKRLQWFLNSLNNAGLSVDGWFGNNTLTAVKNYQTKYNLTADGSGIVGSQTWNSLESKGSASFIFGSGAQVSYSAGGSQHTVIADNEGYYIISSIPAGTYNFTYSMPNYVSQTISVTITSNQTETKNVILQHL